MNFPPLPYDFPYSTEERALDQHSEDFQSTFLSLHGTGRAISGKSLLWTLVFLNVL